MIFNCIQLLPRHKFTDIFNLISFGAATKLYAFENPLVYLLVYITTVEMPKLISKLNRFLFLLFIKSHCPFLKFKISRGKHSDELILYSSMTNVKISHAKGEL